MNSLVLNRKIPRSRNIDRLPPGWQAVPEQSDEQLMIAYAAGDAKAFDLLYERHRAPLYRYILHQVKDPVACNDLYQQTWEKVIRKRSGYKERSPFRAWLFLVARNTVIDHFRRESGRASELLTDLASEGDDPLSHTESSEELGKLSKAIQELPQEQREVVLLRLEGGLDLAEISRITGTGQETCKSRLRYAITKLKATLQENSAAQEATHEH